MPALLLLLAMALAVPAFAQTFPALSGRVVDAADLLDPAQEAQLTQLSEQIEQASSRQFVVATVLDLQGYPIEDYGYKLGRDWKIGQAGANNGILLLVAPNERKVRIEVGYGLEPIMTDALSSIIINQTILPRFRDGDMAGGIIAGAGAIGEQMKLPLEAAEQRAQQVASENKQSDDGGLFVGIFWLCVLGFVILRLVARRGHGRRYRRGLGPVVLWGSGSGGDWGGGSSGGSGWGGFSGGGGGFSGGGGSFGGGGASGGW
ncbi:TPM domain-containing protein [Hephaestia sp. MAHUQ-44]|nr:TPM domain-containing protein [Hephaestia sp. MAHUQ-44]MCM8731876.1 TPM domain-containing protein [Hephaestia sp. MAHUQ-44]